jgi:putative ABC transport system substrate-binding protein
MPVVGYLNPGSLEALMKTGRMPAFREGLAKVGYIDGRDVVIEFRGAEGQYDRLPELARDLVGRRAAVILAATTPAALAAKHATSTIPIVFDGVGGDPVKLGLVASFNRPGGNVTGISILTVPLVVKRLQLLHDLVPTVTTAGVLLNPDNPNSEVTRQELPAAAAVLGQKLVISTARTGADLDGAVASLVEQGARALLVGADPLFSTNQRELLATLAARHRLPAIYEGRDNVMAGGLIGYGPTFNDSVRQAAGYVARILRGEKPADLPVMQPTKFELVINLKTAKTLGLDVPPMLLAIADEVIE